MAEHVLVTGGCGFIGSSLVDALLARGDRVRVLDDLSSGKRENLGGNLAKVDLRVADLRDPDASRAACEGVSLVLHQAARPSVPRSIEDPRGTYEVNVAGTHELLLAALAAGVRRVVFASSSSVYGNQPALPKHEDLPPMPASPYAAHKLAGEQLGLAFARSMGLEFVALRYFNVYGPRQDPSSAYAAVIPAFAAALLAGKAPLIDGDGGQTRDFAFIDDVVRANLLALESKAAVGHAINIAGGKRVSILEVYRILARAAGHPDLAPIHGPPRRGDVRDSHAALDRARDLLGWTPRVSLEDGLARTLRAISG